MTLRAYANKRDASEAPIIEVLRKAGCSVIQLDKPVDLLIGFRSRTILAECKTAKGGFTKDQIDFMASWRGSLVVTLRNVDDALAALKVWGKSAKRASA